MLHACLAKVLGGSVKVTSKNQARNIRRHKLRLHDTWCQLDHSY